MIHIKQDRNKNYYWLSVAKRGGSYEVIGRSSESYSQKHNCEKSVKAEAGVFNGGHFFVIDHAVKVPKYYWFSYHSQGRFTKTHTELHNESVQSEIEFVQKLKK